MRSSQPKELLQGKVTKESLEDIAFKEAARLSKRLPWLLLIPVGLLLLAFVIPKDWWWGLLPPMAVFAIYFSRQQRKLETLQGRAAGRKSRRPRNSGHAYP